MDGATNVVGSSQMAGHVVMGESGCHNFERRVVTSIEINW